MGPEDAVDGALDMVRSGTRGEADGETNVGVGQGSALAMSGGRVLDEGHHPSESTPRVRGSLPVHSPYSMALAEQRPPDAHDRRPLLNGDLEVVAHAHRQLGAEGQVVGAKPFR